eukprot:scaffold375750_cov43-Prasinocladus_malaysianus.AAC.2
MLQSDFRACPVLVRSFCPPFSFCLLTSVCPSVCHLPISLLACLWPLLPFCLDSLSDCADFDGLHMPGSCHYHFSTVDPLVAPATPAASQPRVPAAVMTSGTNKARASEVAKLEPQEVMRLLSKVLVDCLGYYLKFYLHDKNDELWEDLVNPQPPWDALQTVHAVQKYWCVCRCRLFFH